MTWMGSAYLDLYVLAQTQLINHTDSLMGSLKFEK